MKSEYSITLVQVRTCIIVINLFQFILEHHVLDIDYDSTIFGTTWTLIWLANNLGSQHPIGCRDVQMYVIRQCHVTMDVTRMPHDMKL